MKTHRNSVISPAAVIATGLSVFLVSSATAENRTLKLSDSERVAIFDEAGTFTFKAPANVTGTAQILVVGGGGAGGGISGGGGGGGQVVAAEGIKLTPGAELSVVVGAGGTSGYAVSGTNGGTSSILTYTALGGGGGGGGWSSVAGGDGANGGGAGGNGNVGKKGGQPTVPGGFPGGDCADGSYHSQAGGGGAAEAGQGGRGGAGLVSEITGEPVMYGYGGGATRGGLSGAQNEWGRGYNSAEEPGSQGQDGTGGGGGGGKWGGGSDGYPGGTGTVVIRYSLDLTQVAADFTVNRPVGFVPFVTTFTATVDAPEGSTPELTWNFGDGSDEVVTTEDTVDHTYSELGSYSVSLTVEAAGKTFVKRYENLVSVVQETFYVDDDSADPQAPYATEGTAARSLADALALATVPGQTIRVAPGTYVTTSGVNSFAADPSAYEITSGITILGTGATPEEVVFTRSGSSTHRLFYLNHADACIRNVTIRGGSNGGSEKALGGNVYIGANGGTLEDCLIQKGYTGIWFAGGGNVGMEAGRLVRCVLSGGATNPDSLASGRKGGSCVYMKGGLIENSLIHSNTNGYVAVFMTGHSTLASCTIAGNVGTAGAGVYLAQNTCKVVNCAIGGNTASNDATGHGHVWLAANEAYKENLVSCASEVELGANSIQAASLNFAGSGDYRLGAASVCRDAARDYTTSGAVSETDLDGHPRQSGSAIDIGAYEFDAESLSVDFSTSASSAFTDETVTFTAVVSGGEGPYKLSWDFDGDGTIDLTTSDLTATWTYPTPGVYSVSLSVGAASVRKDDHLAVGPEHLYVDDDATDESVFKTIQEAYALAVDGSTIHVAPGEYLVKGDKTLEITKGVSVIGEGAKPTDVVLRQELGYRRYFNFKTLLVGNDRAVIANMTIADGSADNQGAAGCLCINSVGGMVTNCVIRGGVADNMMAVQSAGALVQNGLLTHSVIEDCTMRSVAGSNGPRAQGVFVEGKGRLENCLVRNMKSGVGAAVVVSGAEASMKNCTVVDCVAGKWIQNRGTWYETNACSVVYASSGSVVNTVAYQASRVAFTGCLSIGTSTEFAAADEAAFGPTASCFTTCACEGEAINEGSFVVTAKDFKDAAGGNFTPQASGVLSNRGTDIPGWETLVDLKGSRRHQGKAIDIGCYEGLPAGLAVVIR